MEYSLQLRNKILLILLLCSASVQAYVPDSLDIGYYNLSSTQKYLIRSGNHVPYNKQFVKRVVVGKATIMPNGAIINIPTGPEFVPSYYDLKYNPKWQLKEPSILGDITFDHSEFEYEASTQALINLLFFASHAADIYTTYRGVKYDCISEANPLLPTVPNLGEMFVLKTAVIGTVRASFMSDEEWGQIWWDEWKLASGILTTLVAYNNHRITEKAIDRGCARR
jgi:hypothetical protein